MKQQIFTIVSHQQIASSTYRLHLQGDTVDIAAPGQFVNIGLDNVYLRRPISVCDVEGDVLTLVYRVVGQGTQRLSTMKVGATLDLLVGLGKGYDMTLAGQQPLLIGGGIGVPPLLWLAHYLRKQGKDVRVILGFNTQDEVILENEFRNLGCKVQTMTMDGSYGTQGLVTDAMTDGYTHYYACGPLPMLRAVMHQAVTQGQVSMEARMGCGFGICMGCSIQTKTGYQRVCKEGPVFRSQELDL